MAEVHNVSRVTIRQAIGELVQEGFLTRQHGKGTFVAERKIVHSLGRLLGVVEELAQQNLDVDFIVLHKNFEKPSLEIQKNLCLRSEDDIFSIMRLMMTNKSPLVINYSYMPQNIGHIVNLNCFASSADALSALILWSA